MAVVRVALAVQAGQVVLPMAARVEPEARAVAQAVAQAAAPVVVQAAVERVAAG
jgi:hypothetical protein